MKKYFLSIITIILPFIALAQFTTDDLLTVIQKSTRFPSLRIHSYEETPNYNRGYSLLSLHNYGGTRTAPKASVKNRYLGRILFGGHSGEKPVYVGSISVLTRDNFSVENYPARMDFRLGTTSTNKIRMSIDGVTGNMGIGTVAPRNKLDVNGTIRSKEVRVEPSPWPDFVFEEDYKFPTLPEVEAFIKKNKHLPGIPSANEVAQEGVALGEMSADLLQKIEELTLYTIAQDKEIQKLNKENELLKSLLERIAELEKEIKNKK